MNQVIKYTLDDFQKAVEGASHHHMFQSGKVEYIYGVPSGGIPFALALSHETGIPITNNLHMQNILVVDDIIDSGKTRRVWSIFDFMALVTKAPMLRCDHLETIGLWELPKETWVHFWWEKGETDITDHITRILEYIGEDPNREGLKETPNRIKKSWERLYGGYKVGLPSVSKTFTEGACDDMVVLRDIEFFSTCEHHMLPFFGRAHIGYLPNGKIIGISKLARLLEIFARRLQIQERIGTQVTEAIQEILNPHGCGCVLEAQHFCMTSRGVEKQNSIMVTSSLAGSFREEPKTRAEFLRMIGK